MTSACNNSCDRVSWYRGGLQISPRLELVRFISCTKECVFAKEKGRLMNHQNMGNCLGGCIDLSNATTNMSCHKMGKEFVFITDGTGSFDIITYFPMTLPYSTDRKVNHRRV